MVAGLTCLIRAVFMLTSFTMYSALSVPAMLDDVWMPNLRGLPIGREGEIVAEFEVRTLFSLK